MNSRNASAFDLGQRSLAPKPKQVVVLANESFKLKMKIQDLGFNNQILVINASLLGKKADDLNSFTNRLLKYSINKSTTHHLENNLLFFWDCWARIQFGWVHSGQE